MNPGKSSTQVLDKSTELWTPPPTQPTQLSPLVPSHIGVPLIDTEYIEHATGFPLERLIIREGIQWKFIV